MLISRNPRKTCYYLINYNDNNFRILKNKYQLEKGWELKKNIKSILAESQEEKEILKAEINRISLSRSKSNIRNLCLSNDFEYFGTITINGYFCDRYELSDCQNKLKKMLDRINHYNSYHKKNKLKYIIITEKHKDNAFHFHGLFSGIPLEKNNNGFLHNPTFTKELGYNSFSKIKDNTKVANYITKYITKDCVRNSHNQLYIRSKDLHFATREELGEIDINWKFNNDFCSIYDFDLNRLTEEDKKIIYNFIGGKYEKK